MANSKRRCKHCSEYVTDWIKLPAGTFCSADHAIEWANAAAVKASEKAYKARTAEKKRQIRDNDRSYWMKKAQAAFNAYIRARDAGKPCISSGRPLVGKYDAGHYRSVGAHPELRFCELNCHGQSVADNQHRSGNLLEYRINLIKRIGQDAVDWLEGPHEPKKYTVDDLKAIEKEYKEKLRTLAQ